jgi:hypothetical protein
LTEVRIFEVRLPEICPGIANGAPRPGSGVREKGPCLLNGFPVLSPEKSAQRRSARQRIASSEVYPGEIRPAEFRHSEIRPAEVGLTEVRPSEFRPAEIRLPEIRPDEVRLAEGSASLRSDNDSGFLFFQSFQTAVPC